MSDHHDRTVARLIAVTDQFLAECADLRTRLTPQQYATWRLGLAVIAAVTARDCGEHGEGCRRAAMADIHKWLAEARQ